MRKIVYIISCDDLWEYLVNHKGYDEDFVDFGAVKDEDYKEACDDQGWTLSLDEFVNEFNGDLNLAPTTSYHYIRIYDE